MTEVKIGVNDFGTLFAIYPDGSVRTILVDVPHETHFGTLLVGQPAEANNLRYMDEQSR